MNLEFVRVRPYPVLAIFSYALEIQADINDNTGNMTNRGGQVLTWDVKNRPVSVSEDGTCRFAFYRNWGSYLLYSHGMEL